MLRRALPVLLALAASAANSAEDNLALFQQQVLTRQEDYSAALQRESTRVLDEDAQPSAPYGSAEEPKEEVAFCDRYPESCQAPPQWDCNHTGPDTMAQLKADTGNWRWCWSDPAYLKYTTYCQSGRAAAASEFLFQSMLADKDSDKILDAEAQYCFAAGHCNRSADLDAPAGEAEEAACTAALGPKPEEGWQDASPVLMGMRPNHKGAASLWGRAACGMGLFHCDAKHCQDHLCQHEEMRARHGHLAGAELEKLPKTSAFERDMEARINRILDQ